VFAEQPPNSTDRGGLVDHDQDPPVAGEFVEQRPQPHLGVGQRAVVEPFAVLGQPTAWWSRLPTSKPR
jgi:hypothetical protein